jgi:hypothetical protein
MKKSIFGSQMCCLLFPFDFAESVWLDFVLRVRPHFCFGSHDFSSQLFPLGGSSICARHSFPASVVKILFL